MMETMKQNFEYCHQIFEDSPVNISLIWKKAMESNFEIQKKIQTEFKREVAQASKIQTEQFLSWWGSAIKKPSFENVQKSFEEWNEFWKNSSDKQFEIYSEILKMLEKYWKNIQDRNIE